MTDRWMDGCFSVCFQVEVSLGLSQANAFPWPLKSSFSQNYTIDSLEFVFRCQKTNANFCG